MKVIQKKWNINRFQAILFGLKSRSRSTGLFRSIYKTASILLVDTFRFLLATVLRVVLLYPLRIISQISKFLRGGPKKLVDKRE